jgi:hypothetical protein
MVPENSSTEEPGSCEPGEQARPGERRASAPDPREPVPALSVALTRAIVEQLVRHGQELGRRDVIDLLGMRYGRRREVPEAPAPVSPANLDA